MDDKLKILIADDNEILTKALSKEIRKHEEFLLMDITNNTEEEIRFIEILNPDVVITDIIRKEGKREGLDIIKMYYNRVRPQFIVMSGFLYTDVVSELKKYKIKHYIQKPFEYSKVIDSLMIIKEEIFQNTVKKKYNRI